MTGAVRERVLPGLPTVAARQSRRDGVILRLCAALALVVAAVPLTHGQAHNPPKAQPDTYPYQWTENPFAGDPAQIATGRRLYKNTCYICHLDNGGRGPNLKKSQLKGTAFLRVMREGRKGTQMPSWKAKLSEEQMWQIYSFIESEAAKAP